MTTTRSLIQTLIIAALWIAVLVPLEYATALSYVYPQLEYGQTGFNIIFIIATPIFFLVLIIVRLTQKRFIEAGALFLLPFLFLASTKLLWGVVDREGWKFTVRKPEYLAALAADPSPGPKFHVFNWDEEASGFISMSRDVAIVYDETDEIALEPSSRSPEWIARSEPLPGNGRVIVQAGSRDDPRCERAIRSLGEHFYYVKVLC